MAGFPEVMSRPVLAGNEPWRLVGMFVVLLVAVAAGRGLRAWARHWAARLELARRPVSSAAVVAAGEPLHLFALLAGLRLGTAILRLGETGREWAETAHRVLLSVSVAWLAYRLADAVGRWLQARAARTASKLDEALAPLVRTSLKVTVVALAVVQVATVLSDKPVTSLLAGLGVSGVAVALAAQDTVKNFFGSVVILSDKPFEIGDRVQVDGHDGTIEAVGFRSTRLRTLDGTLVTIPNGELANRTVVNVSRRRWIRRMFTLSLPYETPPERIERAAEIVREILAGRDELDPERPPKVAVHELGTSSVNVLVVYWAGTSDWWRHIEFAERVNLEILRRFAEEGITMAYPTQKVFVAGDSEPQGGRRTREGGGRAGGEMVRSDG